MKEMEALDLGDLQGSSIATDFQRGCKHFVRATPGDMFCCYNHLGQKTAFVPSKMHILVDISTVN